MFRKTLILASYNISLLHSLRPVSISRHFTILSHEINFEGREFKILKLSCGTSVKSKRCFMIAISPSHGNMSRKICHAIYRTHTVNLYLSGNIQDVESQMQNNATETWCTHHDPLSRTTAQDSRYHDVSIPHVRQT